MNKQKVVKEPLTFSVSGSFLHKEEVRIDVEETWTAA